MGNRKHSIIDALPSTLKDTVEQMMQENFTYKEIADFIKQNGYEISTTSVWRYASNLNASIQQLKMAQENFRVIMEEINKYPMLDTTEGIIRLLSHNILSTIQNAGEEYFKYIEPEKMIKQSTALIRAAAYKSNLDLKNKDILDAGFESVKSLVFEAMAKENPSLYNEVVKFLDKKKENV